MLNFLIEGDTLSGFSVHLSNTVDWKSGTLCYQHDITQPLNNIVTIDCFTSGRYVTIYNSRNNTDASFISEFAYINVCEINITGKHFWNIWHWRKQIVVSLQCVLSNVMYLFYRLQHRFLWRQLHKMSRQLPKWHLSISNWALFWLLRRIQRWNVWRRYEVIRHFNVTIYFYLPVFKPKLYIFKLVFMLN